MKREILLTGLLFLGMPGMLRAQSFGFSGQAVSWTTVNPGDPTRIQAGLRYIPALSFTAPVGSLSLEGEFSANIRGALDLWSDDSITDNAGLSPYRLWVKLSGQQFEVRAGLQKINFGSATMLRPLMWFDRIDPRDPLQLTDGVYGVLGRYYFLNNANIWLWGLYGNNKTKGWEIFPSRKNSFEYGGRVQLPFLTGETGFSYHHRKAFPDAILPDSLHTGLSVPENRLALDTRFDWVVGLWFEGSLIHQDIDFTPLKYKTMLTGGMDYTFNTGNGLRLTVESLSFLYGSKAFKGDEQVYFGGISASYPVNLFHELSLILFYDFTNREIYRFLNWSVTYDKWNFYLMGFWNPESFNLYNFDNQTNIFGGWGFQLMAVFNH
ncbi:MAG: hypothetical protein JXR52_04385 [Bacteroidales bacterium]|nr:hypothetical protein [Bacteroidales bacterium]